jgi:hypothetical protein
MRGRRPFQNGVAHGRPIQRACPHKLSTLLMVISCKGANAFFEHSGLRTSEPEASSWTTLNTFQMLDISWLWLRGPSSQCDRGT